MGTRGCVGWTFDGKKYFETYNHYDSDPQYLGENILKELKEINLDDLEKNLSVIKLVKNSSKNAPVKVVKLYGEKYLDKSLVGYGHEATEWYTLLRNMQGSDMLPEIAKGDLKHIIVVKNWLKDSLFCEYGYTLNFKTKKLEFWEGFQKHLTVDNPMGVRKIRDYYPCAIVGTMSFHFIKESSIQTAIDEMYKIYKVGEYEEKD